MSRHRVEYDPAVVDYTELLDVFWRNIDPHDANGQFCGRDGRLDEVWGDQRNAD